MSIMSYIILAVIIATFLSAAAACVCAFLVVSSVVTEKIIWFCDIDTTSTFGEIVEVFIGIFIFTLLCAFAAIGSVSGLHYLGY